MVLISREVAIEEFEEMVTSVSVYGESAEARYANNARLRFIEKLADIPSVPAVPLDKLCEWLAERYEPPYALIDIDKLRIPIDFRQQKEIWMAALTKWMEEQNAAD